MVAMTRQQMKSNDYATFDEAMKAEFGAGYDPSGAYRDLFNSEYDKHGDLTKATATARAKYAADKAAAEAARKAAEAAATQASSGGGSGDSGGGGGGGSSTCNTACSNSCGTECTKRCAANCGGGCQILAGGFTVGFKTIVGDATKTAAKAPTPLAQPKKKSVGGYANHGIYELGELGTETVLTASQTKILRDNILSNRPNSLISLLKSYNEGYDGINNSVSGVTPVEDNSTIIEKVELKMEVKQIANDYDARRAGEQALNEMMRIARKTGAANSIRR